MKTNATASSPLAQYTLKDAVLDAVNTLKTTVGSFSIHDVTNTIRAAVNDGEYILPGLETSSPSGFKFNVNHDAVKEIVEFLLNDGTLANLGLTSVSYGSSHRTFNFGAPTSNPTTTSTTTEDADEDVSDSDSPVAQHIKSYLANRGESATIRQIHSALKINGLTSEALVELVTNLGYQVTTGTTGKFSTYIVG